MLTNTALSSFHAAITSSVPTPKLTYEGRQPTLDKLAGLTIAASEPRKLYYLKLVLTKTQRTFLHYEAINSDASAANPCIRSGWRKEADVISKAEREKGRVPNGWNMELVRPDLNQPGEIVLQELFTDPVPIKVPGTDIRMRSRVASIYECELLEPDKYEHAGRFDQTELHPPLTAPSLTTQVAILELGKDFLLFRKLENKTQERNLFISSHGLVAPLMTEFPIPGDINIDVSCPHGYASFAQISYDTTVKNSPFARQRMIGDTHVVVVFSPDAHFPILGKSPKNIFEAVTGASNPGHFQNVKLSKRGSMRAEDIDRATMRDRVTYREAALVAGEGTDIVVVKKGAALSTSFSSLIDNLAQVGLLEHYRGNDGSIKTGFCREGLISKTFINKTWHIDSNYPAREQPVMVAWKTTGREPYVVQPLSDEYVRHATVMNIHRIVEVGRPESSEI